MELRYFLPFGVSNILLPIKWNQVLSGFNPGNGKSSWQHRRTTIRLSCCSQVATVNQLKMTASPYGDGQL
ncbi:hypothetical protein DPMN_166620 [Dreissena polymorpha]|uniref:Uncharacterized protein n=1 Tax=Dreissena polymorpha TaxID=45954 RepID=A0A9D4EZ72_DREPO|nr:hypothetical protein DPMN_166620 [Dreissena polymorpha]